MTGGHIAILAILSFVFLFTEMFGRAIAGIGVGLLVFGSAWRLESPAWKSLSFSSRHMYLRYFRLCLLEWRFTFIINRLIGVGEPDGNQRVVPKYDAGRWARH